MFGFNLFGSWISLTPFKDLVVKCKGEFKFLQSFKLTASNYQFSCCRPNADVFAKLDSKVETRGNEVSQIIKSKSIPSTLIPKSRYSDLSFSCAWDAERDMEILQGFVYRQNNDMKMTTSWFSASWKMTSRGWHQATCNRLDKRWRGGCVKMRSPRVPIDNLFFTDVPMIGCRDATMVNGKKLADGRRRFLRSVEMKKESNEFRYYFECCRFGA